MPIFFIILITVYLGGNTYIFYRGMQALSGLPCGIKISLAVLFWLATLSIVGTMLTRNIKMPVFLSHTMYEVGTGWLIFTLYMVLFLLAFDLLRLCRVPFNYGFILSLIFTVVLLGYGYYNYRHPKTNTINIALDKPLAGDAKPVKIVAVILSTGTMLTPDDFMLRSPRSSNTVSEKDKYNLERMEKDAINEVMRMCGGNITLAAEMLGITRTSLYRRIEKFRL